MFFSLNKRENTKELYLVIGVFFCIIQFMLLFSIFYSMMRNFFNTIKKPLWIICWWSLFALLLSGFFPGILPIIDSVRIQGQKLLFSSISAIRYPNSSDSDNIDHYIVFEYLKARLQPGDLIFSYREWFVTNDLIDGKWKHASIYVGNRNDLITFLKKYNLSLDILDQYHIDEDDTDMLIIDSTDTGVSIKSFSSLSYLDDIIVFRTMTTQNQTDTMISTIIQQLGKEYNYDFNINDTSRIYCSQLIYQWLISINITIPYTSFAWRSFLYPQDIVDYIFETGIPNQNFAVVIGIKNIQSDPQFFDPLTNK